MSFLPQLAQHIPTVANALLSYFVLGGTDTAVMLAQQAISATGLKAQEFLELKDELLEVREIAEQVKALQANPQNADLQKQLSEALTRHLEQKTAVQVQGDVKADRGGFATAVMQGGTVTITNTFNGKD
ncbi:MAG: hypothetical protein WAQ53_07165 [Thiofilum sp.]|uniref:hypothetical protein n=1 Tax=Thiofilum sp. TaxID=2212733 RepID=UPI0025E9A1E5|nr:hypothetical protein [Thiofilum sp.]MBK8455150.1 hypothetical protein [Thiofilum sp.]